MCLLCYSVAKSDMTLANSYLGNSLESSSAFMKLRTLVLNPHADCG